jgi:hypothetical protein
MTPPSTVIDDDGRHPPTTTTTSASNARNSRRPQVQRGTMEGQRRAKTAVAAATTTTTTMPEKDKRRRRQRQRAMTTTPKHCGAGSTNDTTPTGMRRECRVQDGRHGSVPSNITTRSSRPLLPQHTPPRPQLTINTTNVGQPANDAANDMPPTAGPTDLTSTPYYRCEQLLAGWIRGAGAWRRLGDRG